MATREPEGSKRKLDGSEDNVKGSKRAREEQQEGALAFAWQMHLTSVTLWPLLEV